MNEVSVVYSAVKEIGFFREDGCSCSDLIVLQVLQRKRMDFVERSIRSLPICEGDWDL